jgi:hypothetical protein
MSDNILALEKLDESSARIVLMLNVPMCFSLRHDLSQDLQDTLFDFLNDLGIAFDFKPFLDKPDTPDGPYDSVDPNEPSTAVYDEDDEEDEIDTESWNDFSDHCYALFRAGKLPYLFIGVADVPVPFDVRKDAEGNIESYSSNEFGMYRSYLIKGNNMSEMADCILEIENNLLEEVWKKEQQN